MSFLVLGLAAKQPVSIDDGSPIDTSFPTFVELMNGIGAGIRLKNR
jgi:3-phosphoshikimate 1-carboxyvinyltransferase